MKDMAELRWIGLDRFSGPGEPRFACTPLYIAPSVEMNRKSEAFVPVSCGKPPDALIIFRTKAYSPF